MTQKTLSLPADVYERLRHLRKNDESYGDLVMRLINEHEKKGEALPVQSFAGILSDEDSDDWGEIEEKIFQKRRLIESRDVQLDHQ